VSTATAIQTGVYVYGITDAGESLPPALPGVDGRGVEMIAAGRLAAIVSRVSGRKIRAQRANLAAHHKLLQSLLARRAVVPCAFGTVADDEDQLCETLRVNQDSLAGQLDLLRGKVEMGLSVYWNTSNIFEFFIATNQELREMRDRAFRPGREPSLDERLELGRRFESLLEQCRQRHVEQVTEVLNPYCAAVRPVDPGQEQMIMKLVCLVRKEDQARFEQGVHEAARKFDDHYCFKYSGPWAPFDFVDVNLSLP
jgi:hypothetical protein